VSAGHGVGEPSDRENTLLRLVFRHLPGTVWAVDRNLTFTYATGRLIHEAGLNAGRLIGTAVQDFLGTRDPTEPGIAHHLAALAGEPQSFEYRFHGRIYAVLIEPMPGPDGTVAGCVGAAFDITEQRAAEARLTLSEARLLEAQRTAHVGSFEWDLDANVMNWTDELCRIFGIEPGLLTASVEALTTQAQVNEVQLISKAFTDAVRAGGAFSYEHRILRADGGVRTLRIKGEVITDGHGHPVRLVGSCWDVSELADAARAQEHLLSLLRATIEATDDGILVVDRDRKVVVCNRQFLELWRVPPQLTEHLDDTSLLNHARSQLEDPDQFLHEVEELYANPEVESTGQVRCLDGRIFERYTAPQRIGDAVVGRVWCFRDISEREQLLRSALFLSDASRLLGSLEAEQALDGVARIALPYLGQSCAIDVFGAGGPRRLVAVSHDPRTTIPSELHPSVLAGNSLIYQAGEIWRLGVPLLMKGKLAGAITFSAPPHRHYLPRDLEVAEELARRAALALDNAQLYRRAQEALRARDEFLSVAAHEIRGPLTSLHMAAQGIRKGKVGSAAMNNMLAVVEREDRRLSRFVDELLDLGHFREGRLQLQYEPVSLAEVVRDVGRRLDHEIIRSRSSISTLTEESVVGLWDRFRLEQVVTNVLSNALKFGLGRPIEVRIRARPGRAFLIVTDHGIGIEPDVMPRLFQPFERGVSDRHYGGLGLGLHIAKTIVEAMKGSIKVQSSPTTGTIFTVELPTGEDADDLH
jgi:PAS domain S-box-containing protein